MEKQKTNHYTVDTSWPKGTPHFSGPVVSCDVLTVGAVTEVFVAQRGEVGKVMVYSEDGTFLREWKPDKLDTPHGIRTRVPPGQGLEAAEIWVTDVGQGPNGYSLKMFDRHGNLKRTLGTPGVRGRGLDPLQFDQVSDVAFNSAGEMFVVDGDDGINHRLLKLSTDQKLLWAVGEEGSGPGQFCVPHSVDVDRFGQAWVADRRNKRLQVFCGHTGRYIGEWRLEEEVYGVRFSKGYSHILVLQEKVGVILMLEPPKNPGFLGSRHVIDTLHIPVAAMPHLFSVSQATGAVYVAELGAQRCQKFVRESTKEDCCLSLIITCRDEEVCVLFVPMARNRTSN